MKSTLSSLIAWQAAFPCPATAFAPQSTHRSSMGITNQGAHHTLSTRRIRFKSLIENDSGDGDVDDSVNNVNQGYNNIIGQGIPNDLGLEIIRGSGNEMSDEMWRDVERGAPSRWMVMKDVSGVVLKEYSFTLPTINLSFLFFYIFQTSAFGHKCLHIRLGSGNCILSFHECCLWTGLARTNVGLGRCWNIYKSFRLVAIKHRCKRI